MRTLTTVFLTLAGAGAAYTAYEHPDKVRMAAQEWERISAAWKQSSAPAPNTSAANSSTADSWLEAASSKVRDLSARLDQARATTTTVEKRATELREQSLDEWFQDLTRPEQETAAATTSSPSVPAVSASIDAAAASLAQQMEQLVGQLDEAFPAESAPPAITSTSGHTIARPVATAQTVIPSPAPKSAVVPATSVNPSEVDSRPATSAKSSRIDARQIGTGRLRTLVIAGLNGEDQLAPTWVDQVAHRLENQTAILDDQTFLFIPRANPQGLALKRRFNVQNVDLNRNFPARRYRPLTGFSGTFPGSELETQQLLQLIFAFQPHRVIVVSEETFASRLEFNGAAAELASRLKQHLELRTSRLNFDQEPGSLAEFADEVLGATVVSAYFYPGDDADRIPAQLTTLVTTANKSPLEETVESDPVAQDDLRGASPPDVSPRGFSSTTPAQPAASRRYEELPPPP